MNKKVISAIIVVVFVVVMYFLYSKYGKTAISSITAKSGTSNEENSTPASNLSQEELIKIAINKLSEKEKQDAYIAAKKMFEDIDGINSHDMSCYDELSKSSDPYFAYFVLYAYPSYDKKHTLSQALKSQNWGVLNNWSKHRGWNKENANAVISKIIYRIDNFKL